MTNYITINICTVNMFKYITATLFVNLILLIIVLLCLGCPDSKTTSEPKSPISSDKNSDTLSSDIEAINVPKKTSIPYDLSKPTQKHKLKHRLDEISGLDSWKEQQIVCVQDEKGIIYVYDLTTERITQEIAFGKPGDYEGIEVVDNDIWVLRSDGHLYEIKALGTEEQEKIKHKTFLKTANDVEGLCYDQSNKRLLLACKGSPGKGKHLKGKKAVYAFDLNTQTLQETPFATIALKNLQQMLQTEQINQTYEQVSQYLKINNHIFNPSGIAIHPFTKEIYLISTAGKTLVVLSPAGNGVIHTEKLDPDVLKQPEGITFLDNGDLLISNEGRGGRANILRFTYESTEQQAL